MDRIDLILAQWRRERPELDVEAMGLLGRLANISVILSREMEKTFAQFDLNRASFDVLATLRRSGAPYALSPGDMMTSMMVTSGTMTNRIDQLEKMGYVTRAANPADGRGCLVSLTREGLMLIERAIAAHVQTQARLVAGISFHDRTLLNQLSTAFLASLENMSDK